jgi:hypothetical protein
MERRVAEPLARHPLSYSRFRVWTSCRWRYREEYLRKSVLVIKPPALTFGAIEHELLKAYVDYLVVNRLEYAPELVPVVFQSWLAGYTDVIPEDQHAELRQVLQQFALGFRLDWPRVWATEIPIAIDYDGQPVGWRSPRVWLRGRPDLALVDGRLQIGEVLDWKTTRVPLSERQLQDDLQARTYAFLFSRMNDQLWEIRVRFYYARTGVTRSASFSRRDIQDTWDLWRSSSAQVEAARARLDDETRWGPTPGPHCTGCPVAMSCPLGIPKLADKLALPTTPEQAQALAGVVLVLEAIREQIRDGLKAWVRARETPVDVAGERFDFYASPRWEYDVAAVRRLAAKHFVDADSVLKVDHPKLERLARREGPFVRAVQAEARRDVGTATFTHRKAPAATATAPEPPRALPEPAAGEEASTTR